MFKRYCKLIFITLVIALAFTAFSFSAYALFDPISAAMAGSGVASGFTITGFAGMPADPSSAILNPGVTDPYDWGVLNKYSSVHIVDTDTVEVTLSPDIAKAGQRRLEQVNAYYGLTPGTSHTIGNYTAFGNYVLCYKKGSYWYGPNIVTLTYNSGAGTYTIAPNISLTVTESSKTSSSVLYSSSGIMGSFSNTGNDLQISTTSSRPVVFGQIGSGKYGFKWIDPSNESIYQLVNLSTPSNTGITPTTDTCILSRSQDSEIIDTLGKENKITLPKSYLDDISYNPDSTITDTSVIESLLQAILEAYTEDDIEESIYIDVGPTPPSPTPVPGDTVSDTLWDDFKDYFDESFGDIYDDLHSFKESFGDWVEDVASGWTEVFGDIYDDLHAFKESFGDWVDDVASGWTEIFGDIYSTLSGTVSSTLSTIASAVQSLVSTIENADFEFIDAFWKNFLTPFNNLFNTIKSHLSIWHYVVEWLASISSVFSFYRGVFSGAGSGFLLPIYACFAGTVVIAVYKRFGK